MRKLITLVCLVCVPFICEAQRTNVIFSQDTAWFEADDLWNAHQEVVLKVHPTLPNFRITFRVDELSNSEDRFGRTSEYVLKVFSSESNQLLQTSTDTVGGASFWIGNNQDYQNEFPDVNFDGFTDLPISLNSDVIGNRTYDFWLYNTDTGLFEFSEEFSDLINPIVFINHDKIGVVSRYSCGGYRCGTAEEFKVINHQKLSIVNRETTSLETINSEDYFINTYEEFIDGVRNSIRIDTTLVNK